MWALGITLDASFGLNKTFFVVAKKIIDVSLSLVDPCTQPIYTNCGIAVKDYMGDRERNELTFTMGALVTNVQNKSAEWAIGDHRGDKQKFFRPDHVQLLTRDELAYINDLVS